MERAGRETNASLHQSVSVTGDESEWSLNLPKDRRASSRLVVPWPRHVPELSFLFDFHNEYGPHATLASPGSQDSVCHTFWLSAAQLRVSSNAASVSPYLRLSARPIWHSKMQLHVSMWSVRICRWWWHRRRVCRDVACARRYWAVCLLKHTGLIRRHLRLQSSCPVRSRLGAPASGGVTPEKLFRDSATRPAVGKSVGDDGRFLATSIILENGCFSPLYHEHQGAQNTVRCALLHGLCVSCNHVRSVVEELAPISWPASETCGQSLTLTFLTSRQNLAC